jgi:hypothetical protein
MALANTKANFDAEAEYKAIERTLIETPRGRWFLSEHGRRARRLDSLTLHDAIAKLQDSLREPPALLGQLQSEIEGLQSLLRETRDAIASKQPKSVAGVVGDASAATADPAQAASAAAGGVTSAGHILSVAESIHSLAWDLQAQDLNLDACEQIARQASQMYALSHRHAVESERVRALTDALDGALVRLDGLLQTVAMEAQFDSINPPARPFDDVVETADAVPEHDPVVEVSATAELEDAELERDEPELAPPAAETETADSSDVEESPPELDAFDLALKRAQERDPDSAA